MASEAIFIGIGADFIESGAGFIESGGIGAHQNRALGGFVGVSAQKTALF